MKRLVVVLSSLLVLPAFAEVAPSTYDTEIMFSDADVNDVVAEEDAVVADEVAEQTSPSQKVSGRKSISSVRAAMTGANRQTSRMSTTRANPTASRTMAARGTPTAPQRTSQVSGRRTTTANISSNVAPQRTTTRRPGTTARASVVTSASPLYNSVHQRSTTATRSSITTRGATVRSAAAVTTSTPKPTADTAIETTSELDALKSLTEYCQAQYAACMDNYCNVLDDNQGRCSCSKNIQNYQKIENALQTATESLQDVARSIQYIGLTKDQITTLFSETEAELTLKDTKDNSAIRNSLDKVKRMIVEVKTGTAPSAEDSGMNFDLSGLLNFDVDNTGFDLSAFMNTGASNTNSISNQRGESLYKTASSRCKASVLNSCTSKGVDAAVVTNSYDLEIDKSCLAYERALTDSNNQMATTVANAKEVLKKARLMVAQNKNSYDLRGCVSALETCMQDEYVCGSGYANCLDPSGQYIVNGSVVIGSMPGNNTDNNNNSDNMTSVYSNTNLFQTWKSNNTDSKSPWPPLSTAVQGTTGPANSAQPTDQQGDLIPATTDDSYKYITLYDYIDKTVKAGVAQKSSDKMSEFLQYKIGYHDDKNNKDYGMCMSVLNKCQNYTYTTKGTKTTYNPTNEVIKQFLQRALVTIKLSQDELLSAYAEDCISDVSSCLSANGFETDSPGSTKSRAAVNACYAKVKTCLSVNGNIYGSVQPDIINNWVVGLFGNQTYFTTTNEMSEMCSSSSTRSDCLAVKGYCIASSNTGAANTAITQYTDANGQTVQLSAMATTAVLKSGFCEWIYEETQSTQMPNSGNEKGVCKIKTGNANTCPTVSN